MNEKMIEKKWMKKTKVNEWKKMKKQKVNKLKKKVKKNELKRRHSFLAKEKQWHANSPPPHLL